MTDALVPRGRPLDPTSAVDVLLVLDHRYPVAPPATFYVAPALALRDGSLPLGACADEVRFGARWQPFDWPIDPETWRPGVDTLATTYLPLVEHRLRLRR